MRPTSADAPWTPGPPRSPHQRQAAGSMEAVLQPTASTTLLEGLLAELQALTSAEEAATWAHRVLGAKNSLIAADARQLESAFQAKLATLEGEAASGDAEPASGTPPPEAVRQHRRWPGKPLRPPTAAGIDKTQLTRPEPRRVRDKDHVKFVAKQPCLICGRSPSDAHHLRFAQHRALGRKPSDEFTVPLCRGHHREVHRCGDEAAWWIKAGLDPTVNSRSLWLRTHPLPPAAMATELAGSSAVASVPENGELDQSIGQRGANNKTNPIIPSGSQ
jgi:hypothetical protein